MDIYILSIVLIVTIVMMFVFKKDKRILFQQTVAFISVGLMMLGEYYSSSSLSVLGFAILAFSFFPILFNQGDNK